MYYLHSGNNVYKTICDIYKKITEERVMYAPIIVFAYNRPDHLKRTLTALTKNKEAKESDLFIFVDGPKSDTRESIKMKRCIQLQSSMKAVFFKKVIIRKSNKNKGFA